MSQNGAGFNRRSKVQINAISREMPVLIAGPTASGKSAVAMEIAARDGRVVVNADALQVYANWRILTARPSEADEAVLPHALYGHVAPDQPYSVGHWLREVAPLLARPVMIVGGTGLNFTALTRGLADIPVTPPEVRAEADALMAAGGQARMLAVLDPETVARIDVQNGVRVQRAWEVQRTTGRGLAWWQDQTPAPLLPLTQVEALVQEARPEWLNQRIDQRFARMLDDGALAEVRANRDGWNPTRPASRAIGAAELMAHLDGALTLTEAAGAATLASRQYAKRQRTWFRSNMQGWQTITLP